MGRAQTHVCINGGTWRPALAANLVSVPKVTDTNDDLKANSRKAGQVWLSGKCSGVSVDPILKKKNQELQVVSFFNAK